jgi:hypothetical protein
MMSLSAVGFGLSQFVVWAPCSVMAVVDLVLIFRRVGKIAESEY